MRDELVPHDQAELVCCLKSLRTPRKIVGGATRGDYGGQPVISLRRITGIDLYEPGALTLVVRAGTPVATIKATLVTEGQQLAFEPPDYRPLLGTTGTPTIGGIYGGNHSGPRRIQAGAIRDFALGVCFVDGLGRVIRNGGRVMKNVTGYDLVKLMAGSQGRLGAVTEISLKVLPTPEQIAQLDIAIDDPDTAVRAMSMVLGSPYGVTGAAWVNGHCFIRIEGFENSVKYRLNELRKLLDSFGPIEVSDGNDVRTNWQWICDAKPFWGLEGDIWRIAVKPVNGPKVMDVLSGPAFLDWGGGLVWALVSPQGTDVPTLLARAGILAQSHQLRGYCNYKATDAPAVEVLKRGLKAQFDPKDLLLTIA